MSARSSSALRSISAYLARGLRLGLLASVALFGASFPWLFLARLSAQPATGAARIDAAPIAADAAQLGVKEKPARPEVLTRRAALMRAQIAAVERELGANRRVGAGRVAEARAHHREASAAVAFARSEAARAERLYLEGVGRRADVDRAKAEVVSREAQAEAARAAVDRAGAESLVKESEIEAKAALLARELAELQVQATQTAEAADEPAAATAAEHDGEL